MRNIFASLNVLVATLPVLLVQGGPIDGVIGGVQSSTFASLSPPSPTTELYGQVPFSKNVDHDLSRFSGHKSARTPGKLRVTENSGVCETTEGVYQASGYGDLSTTESIWSVTWCLLTYVIKGTSPLGSGFLKPGMTLITRLSRYGSMAGFVAVASSFVVLRTHK